MIWVKSCSFVDAQQWLQKLTSNCRKILFVRFQFNIDLLDNCFKCYEGTYLLFPVEPCHLYQQIFLVRNSASHFFWFQIFWFWSQCLSMLYFVWYYIDIEIRLKSKFGLLKFMLYFLYGISDFKCMLYFLQLKFGLLKFIWKTRRFWLLHVA